MSEMLTDDRAGSRTRPLLLAAGAVAVFGMLVCSRTLLLGYVHYFNDIRLAFYPWHVYIAEQRAAGNWLPWCHLHGCGYPLWSNGQSGVFYPLNLLFLLPLDKAWLYSLLTWLHHVLAGLGMVLLARMMRIGRLGAVAAGVIFAFSGFIWSHQIQYAMLCAMAWMPWCALGAVLWSHRRSVGGLLLCALAFAAAVINHPQPPLIIAPFAIAIVWVYGAVRSQTAASSRPRTFRRFAVLLLPLVLGGLLAAVAWVPMVDLMDLGIGSGRVGYEFMTSYSMEFQDLVKFVFPRFIRTGMDNAEFTKFNYWEDCGYIGALALIGALIITPTGRALRALRRRLLVVSGIAVVLALGGNTPVYRIFAYLPAYNRFRVPGRWLAIWSAAAALLIGLAITVLPRRLEKRDSATALTRWLLAVGVALAGLGIGLAIGQSSGWRPPLLWIATMLLTVAALGLLGRGWWRDRSHLTPGASAVIAGGFAALAFGWVLPLRYTPHLLPEILGLALACLLCAGSFFLVLQRRLRPVTATGIFSVIALLQIAHFAWWFFPVSQDRSVLHWPPEALAHVPPEITDGRFVRSYAPWMHKPWPNVNLVDGFATADIYDPFGPPVQDVIYGVDRRILRPETAAAFGISRIITDVPPDEAPDDLEYLGTVPPREPWGWGETTWVYRNPAFRGIAWTVTERSPARTDTPGRASLPVLSMDAPSLEPPPAGWSDGPRDAGTCEVREWSARRIRIEVGQGAHRALVLTHSRLPGWRAEIDGEPVSLLTANGVFTAVELPDEPCEVVLSYTPHGLRKGGAVTLLAAVLLGVLALWVHRSRARKRTAS